MTVLMIFQLWLESSSSFHIASDQIPPTGCHAVTLPSDMSSIFQVLFMRTPLVSRFTITHEFFNTFRSEDQKVGWYIDHWNCQPLAYWEGLGSGDGKRTGGW